MKHYIQYFVLLLLFDVVTNNNVGELLSEISTAPMDSIKPSNASSEKMFGELARSPLEAGSRAVLHNQSYTLPKLVGSIHSCKNFFFEISEG